MIFEIFLHLQCLPLGYVTNVLFCILCTISHILLYAFINCFCKLTLLNGLNIQCYRTN